MHRHRRPGPRRVLLGPEAADSLTYASFGDAGTREFFTHVRFHKHDEDRIISHLLVELYARTEEEAIDVLEEAARGALEITSLAEESRPPGPLPAKRTRLPGTGHLTPRTPTGGDLMRKRTIAAGTIARYALGFRRRYSPGQARTTRTSPIWQSAEA